MRTSHPIRSSWVKSHQSPLKCSPATYLKSLKRRRTAWLLKSTTKCQKKKKERPSRTLCSWKRNSIPSLKRLSPWCQKAATPQAQSQATKLFEQGHQWERLWSKMTTRGSLIRLSMTLHRSSKIKESQEIKQWWWRQPRISLRKIYRDIILLLSWTISMNRRSPIKLILKRIKTTKVWFIMILDGRKERMIVSHRHLT